MTLDEIGLTFGTDKSSAHHDYLRFYERFFGERRTSAGSVLEIGIFGGASLRTWEAYFERATIIGADIDPSTRRFAQGRIAVEIIDQSNLEALVALALKHAPFDIIIEDGSHHWEHQITTLRTLFPFLKPGGIYIVEDLQTNYGEMAKAFRGVASSSCMEYLKRATDLRVADDMIDVSREEDAFLRTYARRMNLTFYRRACLIEKLADEHTLHKPPLGGALIVGADVKHPLVMSAHLGDFGDVRAPGGWIRTTGQNHNIQGFAIHPSEALQDLLHYRARLDDGTWTKWVRAGEFAGTRGACKDLTGFSVKLAPAIDTIEIRLAGLFRSEDDPVIVAAGEPCIPRGGGAALYGMQMVIEAAR